MNSSYNNALFFFGAAGSAMHRDNHHNPHITPHSHAIYSLLVKIVPEGLHTPSPAGIMTPSSLVIYLTNIGFILRFKAHRHQHRTQRRCLWFTRTVLRLALSRLRHAHSENLIHSHYHPNQYRQCINVPLGGLLIDSLAAFSLQNTRVKSALDSKFHTSTCGSCRERRGRG
jgi:hypothetical protein